jgi:mannose-6-phosphate isomerase-like protein (cupin superfamily)
VIPSPPVPGYTKVNLKSDVEDSATKFGYAPNLEARFAAGDLALEKSAVSYQRLAPGFRLPFGHSHDRQEELYVVLSGTGRLKLDDEIVEVGPLDAVRIAPEVTRGFEAGPDGVEILAFGAPNTGGPADDVKPAPGWWSD